MAKKVVKKEARKPIPERCKNCKDRYFSMMGEKCIPEDAFLEGLKKAPCEPVAE